MVRADYERLSLLICKVFEKCNENPEIYYTNSAGKAKGKLYNAYSNYKTKLAQSNTIKRKTYKKGSISQGKHLSVVHRSFYRYVLSGSSFRPNCFWR